MLIENMGVDMHNITSSINFSGTPDVCIIALRKPQFIELQAFLILIFIMAHEVITFYHRISIIALPFT